MEYSIERIAEIVGFPASGLNPGRITALLTDSRRLSFPETTLFFALRTETNDGHRYIDDLYGMRVRNFVVEKLPENVSGMSDANFIVVASPLEALQKIAAWHRSRFSFPVVGITGSNGKTSAKEFLYQLLRNDFDIVRSPLSYNSKIGVPLSVWEMHEGNTLGIFEAGISAPGEMDALESVIRPTIGLITSIGEAHQENFSSMEAKCLEKLKLFRNSEAVVYDKDSEVISSAVEAAGLSSRSFAWSRRDRNAPLYVKSVEKMDTETSIVCEFGGKTRSYTIPFTDDASVENAIHCMALMVLLKLKSMDDASRFSSLEPVAMRLEVKQGQNNCLVINDTYNSDINSLSVALDFQLGRKKAKKLKSTVILSDMLESGTSPEVLYRKVADLMSLKKVEKFVGIGPEISSYSSFFSMEKEFFRSTEDFLRSSSLHGFKDEIILVKGARSFHFETVTERLEKKVHETILEVNLDAVVHNFNFYRSRLKPETKMVCMVKAFAYGAGSYEIAKTLQEHRCDYLAVAVADEGVELRKEGVTIPIMVMNPEPAGFNAMFEYSLEPEVYSFRMLEMMIEEARARGIKHYPIHLKVDTGMHRLGFRPDQMSQVCARVLSEDSVEVKSVFSHLVGSDSPEFDDFTLTQIERFRKAASDLEAGLGHKVIKHILNTAGIERFTDFQMDMVRLGIGLYGVSASGMKGLRGISTLKTTILQIQEVPAGDSVGYGRRTFVDRDSRVAVIPVGYADGFDRHLSNRLGSVIVNGVRCPILGNICMDACMIDVTDADAHEGDTVLVFGEGREVSDLSEELGTIPYEVLTSVSPRVVRVYYRES